MCCFYSMVCVYVNRITSFQLSFMFSCKYLLVTSQVNGNLPLEQIRAEIIHSIEQLTFIAAMSLSYDSLIFFITSSSALEHASMAPFTVMVRSGLYKVRSWSLEKGMGGCHENDCHSIYVCCDNTANTTTLKIHGVLSGTFMNGLQGLQVVFTESAIRKLRVRLTDLRWDCDLGPCVLLDFLQVASFLPN